jgi:hypothetical protein
MKIKNKYFSIYLAIIFQLVFNMHAQADGKVFIKKSNDSWIVGKELAQRAVINHNDGIQKMDISIDVQTSGKSGLWLFPVPADAKDIELDVSKGFKVPQGDLYSEIKRQAIESYFQGIGILISGTIFGGCGRLFVYRALVSTFFGSESFLDDGVERKLAYHKAFSKLGLESEIVKAYSVDDLFNFFSSRGLEIPDDDREIWNEYHNNGYSFIVSRFNPSSSDIKPQSLSLNVGFPSERAFFPLKPTKTYGQEIIPLEIYVNDFKKISAPDTLTGILETDYLLDRNKKKIIYTRFTLNAPAKLFIDDMWYDPSLAFSLNKIIIENTNSFDFPNSGFILIASIFVLLLTLLLYKSLKKHRVFKLLLFIIGGLSSLYFFRKHRSDNKILYSLATFILTPMVLITSFGDLLFVTPFLIFSYTDIDSEFALMVSYLEGSIGALVILIGLLTYFILFLRLIFVVFFTSSYPQLGKDS